MYKKVVGQFVFAIAKSSFSCYFTPIWKSNFLGILIQPAGDSLLKIKAALPSLLNLGVGISSDAYGWMILPKGGGRCRKVFIRLLN